MALVKILLYILKYPDNMNNVKVALVPYDRHGEHPDPDFITLMNNAGSLARNDLMEVNALWEAYIGGDASKLIDLACKAGPMTIGADKAVYELAREFPSVGTGLTHVQELIVKAASVSDELPIWKLITQIYANTASETVFNDAEVMWFIEGLACMEPAALNLTDTMPPQALPGLMIWMGVGMPRA